MKAAHDSSQNSAVSGVTSIYVDDPSTSLAAHEFELDYFLSRRQLTAGLQSPHGTERESFSEPPVDVLLHLSTTAIMSSPDVSEILGSFTLARRFGGFHFNHCHELQRFTDRSQLHDYKSALV